MTIQSPFDNLMYILVVCYFSSSITVLLVEFNMKKLVAWQLAILLRELALCRAWIVMLHGSPHLNFLSYRWSLDIRYVMESFSFLFILVAASLFLSILFWVSHNFLITILLILLPLGNSSIVVCYIQLTSHDLGGTNWGALPAYAL